MLFIIMFFPLIVFGKSNITIQTSVSVDGKKLEDGEFSFQLKDKEGNIIQTKKNDSSGKVVFDSIEIDDVSSETNTIYFIEEVNSKQKGYTYDDNIVYVRVYAKPGEEAKVFYYKKNSIEEEMKKKIPKYEPKEAYHATEEDLKGDAYAVFDMDSETLYFKRYEKLDTSNFDYPFDSSIDPDRAVNGHTMYLRNVETNKNKFTGSFIYCYYIDGENKCPKKVVFEEAFKPTFTDGSELFVDFKYYVKEVDFSHFDTSNITNMSKMFLNFNYGKLDLTSFDTSNVTDMSEMFERASINELDITSFRADSLKNMNWMFSYMNTNELKISSLFTLTDNIERANRIFYNFNGLETIDFSWFKIEKSNVDLSHSFQMSSFKYIDLSNWKFKNTGSISCAFSNMENIEYLNLSNMTSDECGIFQSNDIWLNNKLKVIVLSNQYNMKYSMFVDSSIKELYNTKINDFTNELCSDHLVCEYYHGDTYLNIQDESDSFMNFYRYVPDSIVDNIITNPITRQSLFGLSIILFGFICYSAVMFTRRSKKSKR